MSDSLHATVSAVHDYWNARPLGLQYVTDEDLEVGSPEFFAHIRPWMNPYKFPWIMQRIEHKEEDPPVNEFLAEQEILAMFEGFEIIEAVREHYRALPVRRSGLKAALYRYGFRPVYNLIPEPIATRFAYKYSVAAVKRE